MAEKKKTYSALFRPIKIHNVEVKNRIGMAPMATNTAAPGGYVTEALKAWLAARAKGGVGLIWTEAVRTTPVEAWGNFTLLALFGISYVPALSELAETIHAFGSKLVVQLMCGFGRQQFHPVPKDLPSYAGAASAKPYEVRRGMLPKIGLREHAKRGVLFAPWEQPDGKPMVGPIIPEMTTDDITFVQEHLAIAAVLARKCGADAIEIHMANGYLIHSFFSPRSNKRTDRYGGSFENRARFARELMQKTRQIVGPDYCLGFRMSGEENMPDGFTHHEMKELAISLEELGADYCFLSNGSYEAMKDFFPDEDGTMLKYAESLKKVLKIPVITPSIHDPANGEKAVHDGKTDMVALGRPLIADPDWPNKVAEGKRPTMCTRCNIGCQGRVALGLPVRCTVNPRAGLELYMPEYKRSAPFRPHWDIANQGF